VTCQQIAIQKLRLSNSDPTNTNNTACTESSKRNTDMFRVQVRKDGERGVYAGRDIGPSNSPSHPNQTYFRSLAPPILFQECRTSNCALCFQVIDGDDDEHALVLCDNPRYPVVLCSKKCSEQAKSWLPDEIAIVEKMMYSDPNMMVLPMALYVYRLLKVASWDEVMAMKSHNIVDDDALLETVYRLGFGNKQSVDRFLENNSSNGHELIQRQCVILTVSRMLYLTDDIQKRLQQYQSSGKEYQLSEDFISDLLQRIKYNAFTIVEEGDAPGFGLYEGPSYRINHACNANTSQTYRTTKGQSPQLCISIHETIKAGQEISIRYMDCEGVSMVDRRQVLAKKYRFHCRCSLCTVEEK
jgi:hypothetical protein